MEKGIFGRERLIELISNAPRKDIVYGDIKLDKPAQTVQTIADHLLANGVIVPPCKFGDFLYCIITEQSIGKIIRRLEVCCVNEIISFPGGAFVVGVTEVNTNQPHNVTLGENAFKTFEEAVMIWHGQGD